jgi:hypothetical protein
VVLEVIEGSSLNLKLIESALNFTGQKADQY